MGGGALTRREEGEPDGWQVGVDRYIFICEQETTIGLTRGLVTYRRSLSRNVRPAVTGPIRICLAPLFFLDKYEASNQGGISI